MAQLGELNGIIYLYPSKEIDENDKPSLEASVGRTGKSVTSANVMFCPVRGVGC